MSVATITCAHILGLQSEKVVIEVDVGRGLYSFGIVGLPDKAIEESKDRIIASLKNSGAKNPKTENQKVIVSLTPASTKKEGSYFDVPIALAYLAASSQLSIKPDDGWFVGELSLTGDILPMKGILLVAECAKAHGAKALYVPYENKEEAALIEGINIYACKTLSDIVFHFGGTLEKNLNVLSLLPEKTTQIIYTTPDQYLDFKDIKGQSSAKRALEIAAAGGHNIALYGPPGTGKTMLARAFTGILPPLKKEEALEVTRIHSLTSKESHLITYPQLRSPHHTSSHVSLVGGGANPRPGEVTLAHLGVLFLDEFPEFDKRVIESLREPLEEGRITISRAKGSFTFPASCTLIASMNPCPCGYLGSKVKRCVCKPSDIDRYARKLSGPIMDRIDMWVPVLHINYDTLSEKEDAEGSNVIRERIKKARLFATERFKKLGINHISKNKDIHSKNIDTVITLDDECKTLMKQLSSTHLLSPRAYHRVLRLSRTIADYAGREHIIKGDILEAFQYRPKLYQDRL